MLDREGFKLNDGLYNETQTNGKQVPDCLFVGRKWTLGYLLQW